MEKSAKKYCEAGKNPVKLEFSDKKPPARIQSLVTGSAIILKTLLKNSENPNLAVKGLDIIFREKPLGSFAVDVCQLSPDVEKIQDLTNKLYANLIDKNTNT